MRFTKCKSSDYVKSNDVKTDDVKSITSHDVKNKNVDYKMTVNDNINDNVNDNVIDIVIVIVMSITMSIQPMSDGHHFSDSEVRTEFCSHRLKMHEATKYVRKVSIFTVQRNGTITKGNSAGLLNFVRSRQL